MTNNRNDDVDAFDILLSAWRQWCAPTTNSTTSTTSTNSSKTSKASSKNIALLGHVLRNLSLSNKARFMAHSSLLEEMLESMLRVDKPIVVACAASVLWSVSYNYKKIIPRMKKCHGEAVLRRGLEILQVDMLKGCGEDKHLENMVANGVQGLVRLTDWCKTNGMSSSGSHNSSQKKNRKISKGNKSSP